MSITKTGSELLVKEAGALNNLGAYLKAWPKNPKGLGTMLWDGIGKPVKATGKFLGYNLPKALYKTIKPVAGVAVGGVTKGVSAIGRGIANHPYTVLPAVGLGTMAAISLKPDFKKNWLHMDPTQDLTYASPLTQTNRNGFMLRPGAIRFRDPLVGQYYKNPQSDHILY